MKISGVASLQTLFGYNYGIGEGNNKRKLVEYYALGS
jgi:hypothetical protein